MSTARDIAGDTHINLLYARAISDRNLLCRDSVLLLGGEEIYWSDIIAAAEQRDAEQQQLDGEGSG